MKIKRSLMIVLMGSVILGMLSGCEKKGEYSSDKVAYKENIIKSVIEAANDDDADALVELFSSDIVKQNSKLNSEAQAFVEMVDGEFVSDKKKYEEVNETKSESSKYQTEIVCQYVVETTTGKYVIAFVDFPEVNNDEYKGLQSLGVQDFDDFENEECFASVYDGIYVVTPDNHEEIKQLRDN